MGALTAPDLPKKGTRGVDTPNKQVRQPVLDCCKGAWETDLTGRIDILEKILYSVLFSHLTLT